MLQTGRCKKGRVCAAILERSYVAGALHIRPLLGSKGVHMEHEVMIKLHIANISNDGFLF
jgi:hypothetical protein